MFAHPLVPPECELCPQQELEKHLPNGKPAMSSCLGKLYGRMSLINPESQVPASRPEKSYTWLRNMDVFLTTGKLLASSLTGCAKLRWFLK